MYVSLSLSLRLSVLTVAIVLVYFLPLTFGTGNGRTGILQVAFWSRWWCRMQLDCRCRGILPLKRLGTSSGTSK